MQLGRIDILVNNAGIGLNRSFLDTTFQEWERVLLINLTGSFLCAQSVARHMVKNRTGRIINISSISGQRGGVGRAAYGASKAGVVLLTKAVAAQYGRRGIRCNAVAPGLVVTPALKHHYTTPETIEASLAFYPMPRLCAPEDVAGAVVFLASDDAAYVNAATLMVDGGATVYLPSPQSVDRGAGG